MSEPTIPFYVPAIASMSNGFLFAPFELASTRSKSVHTNIHSFQLLRQIVRQDGFRSLWAGSSWFVAGCAVSRSIWLQSYHQMKPRFQQNGWTDQQSTLAAGFGSGILTAGISNPIWTIKSYAQLPNYPSLIYGPDMNAVHRNWKYIFQPRVLMSGTVPTMAYVSLESMSQFYFYEQLKSGYRHHWGDPSPPVNGLLAGLSRIAILPFTYPLHVLSLRYRENKLRGQSQTFQQIIQTIRHRRAWYNGSMMYACRVVPQATVLFFIYESFVRLLQ